MNADQGVPDFLPLGQITVLYNYLSWQWARGKIERGKSKLHAAQEQLNREREKLETTWSCTSVAALV